MEKGWIWCEPDGTIVGVASDGREVQLGMCLFKKPAKPGKTFYPWFPLDAATLSYLTSHPNPEDW